jgi:putative FmdB family regulatory protein
MPLYEFACTSCGHRFDRIMKFSDPEPACPACAADRVRRLVSLSAFQLTGTGWYTTDYERKSSVGGTESGAGGSAGAPAAEASSSERSGESATAASAPASSTTGSTSKGSGPGAL